MSVSLSDYDASTIWRNPRLWAVVTLVLFVFGSLYTVSTYLRFALGSRPDFTWALASAGDLPFWLAQLIMFPLIIWAVHRVPIQGPRWGRVILFHSGVSVVHMALKLFLGLAMAFPLVSMLGDQMPFPAGMRQVYLNSWAGGIMMYWALAAIVVAVDHAIASRERERQAAHAEIRAAQLETNLERARLDWLRSQLNPHFLFNTLNTISSLARQRRTDAVISTLTRLGDLLRATLSHSSSVVPLRAELELLDKYLDIERLRFGDRLTITTDVEAAALDVAVPSLILQPIVENAMKHGVGGMRGAVRISIRGRIDAERLELEVSDSGHGFDPGWEEGVGLSNTRSRLRQIYDDAASMAVESRGRGATVRIFLPYRLDPGPHRSPGEHQGQPPHLRPTTPAATAR